MLSKLLRCPNCHCFSLEEGVKIKAASTQYICLARCGFEISANKKNLEYIVLKTLEYERENEQYLD